jgi:hypothetical protein
MSYDSNRIREQLRVLEPEINNFIARYNSSLGPLGGLLPRQTVFLLPGGMASRLVRAKTKFNPIGPNQVFAYDELWLNEYTFLEGTARDLKMHRGSAGDLRDKNDKIIVADALVNLWGVTPYSGFTEWFELLGYDYFVFPYDWRRSVADVGDLFVSEFLPHFQSLVRAGCLGADPLARFSVVGHSLGGMLTNWALRSGNPVMAGLDKAITVGTPFYGYGRQLHRWFEGEPLLNGWANLFRNGIIDMICSLPGCYALMFLPYTKYLVIQGALAADLSYPLSKYPCVDLATGVPADPYNPLPNRYPSNVDPVELATGKVIVEFLSSSLTPAQAAKFWNIRGDTMVGNTLHEVTWRSIPPTIPCPITDVSVTPGDGTQPAWTTRHVDLDAMVPSHVVTIRSSLAEHLLMINEPQTLLAITSILALS